MDQKVPIRSGSQRGSRRSGSCCRSRTNADDSYAQQDIDRCSTKNVTRSSRGYTPMQVVVWAKLHGRIPAFHGLICGLIRVSSAASAAGYRASIQARPDPTERVRTTSRAGSGRRTCAHGLAGSRAHCRKADRSPARRDVIPFETEGLPRAEAEDKRDNPSNSVPLPLGRFDQLRR
jgi:hypothetical protein